MSVEKFTSGKASIECRHNPKEGRHRCHVTVGRTRVGPLFARTDDADEAARKALEAAIKRGLVEARDVERDGDAIVVHAADGKRPQRPVHGAKQKAAPSTKRKVAPSGSAKPAAKTRKKGPPIIVGNGKETRALEKHYQAVKREYHETGEALRERHDAIAALEAEGHA